MKQITRQEKEIIVANGWDNDYWRSGCKGITITSRTHSKAKTYWAVDSLAFKVWDHIGRTVDDKEYKEWQRKYKK